MAWYASTKAEHEPSVGLHRSSQLLLVSVNRSSVEPMKGKLNLPTVEGSGWVTPIWAL